MRAVLLLGTNLGDRDANIQAALNHLKSQFGEPEAVTRIIKTEAVGFDGPEFLNCIAVFDVECQPLELLHICKEIARKMGRTDPPEYDSAGNRVYHNRIIDIDILFFGEEKISTPELTIPHPQVYSRPFVSELLTQLRRVNSSLCETFNS